VIQILNNRLCSWCGKGCYKPCEPLQYILQAYDRQRTEDKKELLKILRNDIEIIDYEPSPEYAELGNKVIDKIEELSYIRDFEIKIGYVLSYEAKTKDGQAVFADCRKVNGPYRAYLPYDIVITFYEPNTSYLSENQQKVLMWHELRHITIGPKGIKVQDHDVKDWRSVVDALGLDWFKPGQEIIDILGGNDERVKTKSKSVNKSKPTN
jgi:hypothetical protein